ncbi:MAG: YbaB/EbfC family nucleoid-associated protein [Lachnospiraceae bacterium]|nr:YbaB/EbfC family nucleoid-associated protein [Lachnospiraceae bacterium]
MAKRGGYPGGMMPGNMSNMLKQAQRMQRQMEENQREMETREFTATAGGNAISVTITGKREVTKVTIDPEVLDPEDVEELQDLIMVAMNDVLNQVETANNDAMNKMTGGMNLGGLSF